jgi:hypothetical protein
MFMGFLGLLGLLGFDFHKSIHSSLGLLIRRQLLSIAAKTYTESLPILENTFEWMRQIKTYIIVIDIMLLHDYHYDKNKG